MPSDEHTSSRLRLKTRLGRALVRLDLKLQPRRPRSPLLAPLARRLNPEFQDCWVLMDRDTEAHDNAEHLYRYLREQHPDINAWFVLARSSSEWDRLERDGFRLLAYGSSRHVRALLQCRELISSQIDHYVISPLAIIWVRLRPWRFTWLQHGVIQSDLSRWLNGKPARTVVATTPGEFRSLTNPPYWWTEREVVLTGQARHDDLLRKASAVPAANRTLVVFMPTWRDDLLVGSGASNERVPREGFWESEYATNWLGLLSSPKVRDAAGSRGLELVFMPHPNMEPLLDAQRLPAGVRVASYTSDDVQDVLAHASQVVTDYSSNAFEAALIDRPVLYFQFDAEAFHNGSHIGRPGYFDYVRDGFGPVATTLDDAERALVELVEDGGVPREPYAGRIRETFILRDGQARRRIVEAIRAHAAAS